MTSNRGQNVWVLERPAKNPWDSVFETFNDRETSFRCVQPPRNNTMNGKVKIQNNELKKCSNSLIANTTSANREMSPFRWCDRDVDGISLGRSGWVQVQHRSLDDEKTYGVSDFSTLPSRKNYPGMISTRSVDRRERTRPVNLPIKNRTNRENRERPCKFNQELGSVSPPSITPIISPPPAFKDDKPDKYWCVKFIDPPLLSPDDDTKHYLDDYKTFEDITEQKENSEGLKFSKLRSRNQRDGRRDFGEAYKTRSSNSRTSNWNEKNSEKIDLVGDQKLYVKRSRSLQFSDIRPPCEPINRSLSGKANDSYVPEHRGQHSQCLHPMLVTEEGVSIPVFASHNQSLSRIAPSETEQKKLIKEAEKEARIISEFLNRTRSREAARNLLMHRYFKHSEDYPENLKTKESIRFTDRKSHNRRENFYQTCHQQIVYPKSYATSENEILYENPSNWRKTERFMDHRFYYKNQNRWNQKQTSINDIYEQVSSTHSSSISTPTSASSISDKLYSKFLEIYDNDDSNSKIRSNSAPETNDSIPLDADCRSMSLPSSFRSERRKINQTRDFFWWRPHDMETPGEVNQECALPIQQGSKTAPTTPVRDNRYDRTQYKEYIGCLVNSLSDDDSLGITQKIKPGSSAQNRYKGGQMFCLGAFIQNSSGKTSKKIKKNSSLKNLRTKDYSGHDIEGENSENSNIMHSVATGLTSSLEVLGKDYQFHQPTIGTAIARIRDEKTFKNEKYDSHDSGIQMGNRGNVESSESQDTDFQEDCDSPIAVRRREILKENFCKPQSEVFNQILIDKYKADLQWRNKSEKNNGKGVRRTNSDLGGQRLYNWEVKKPNKRYFNSSSLRRTPEEVGWRSSGAQDSATLGRSLKPRLRRSLSQPLGLNELPPFIRRRSSTIKCFAMSEDEKPPRGRNSEDEMLSDSESSIASLTERKKSFEFAQRDETIILAEAVWDHVAIESCELPFRAGDVIEVLNTRDRDWWWGATSENIGYFPSAFVRLRVSQEDTVEDYLAAVAKGKHASTQLRRGKSVSLLSNDQVRSSIVRELLNTERDFVKIMRDVRDGYIIQCKRRMEMFTPVQITTIFSNLEDILVFQEKFLKDLEDRVDIAFPHKSCIGEVFLNHSSGFRMYSEYCNSHPMAIATLQGLYQKDNYSKFFETCRLKQNLIEIPLDGYLLTPVQRICKYPLQLAELLKYTKPDHPDYIKVEEALETMRSVADLINERKRKMESLEKLAAWQQRVDGWEGEDLIEISSQLIHQGEVVKITTGIWTSNVTLFLFDHQIIYCKKDLLKRNVYIYKGRFYLDGSIVTNVPDGKNQQLGVNVKYGLQISNILNDKWLLFCCRSSEDKAKWLQALTEEKKIVTQDKEVGLDLPPTAKQLAKLAAKTKKCPPYKPRGKNKFGSRRDPTFTNSPPDTSKPKSHRKVGTWFTLSGVMKGSKVNLKPRASPHRII